MAVVFFLFVIISVAHSSLLDPSNPTPRIKISKDTSCVPKFQPCGATLKNASTASNCCLGLRCVGPKNVTDLGGEKLCEPLIIRSLEQPASTGGVRSSSRCSECQQLGLVCPNDCGFDPICVPRWSPCSGPRNRFRTNKCCARGWRCVWPKKAPNFGAKRCEPPPPRCIPNWYKCENNRGCCSRGWRCKRPRNPRGFPGTRCEP